MKKLTREELKNVTGGILPIQPGHCVCSNPVVSMPADCAIKSNSTCPPNSVMICCAGK